jgi:signal transduction histidine kinase
MKTPRIREAVQRKNVQDGLLAFPLCVVDLIVSWSRNSVPADSPWLVVTYAFAGYALLAWRRQRPGWVLAGMVAHSLLSTAVTPTYQPLLGMWIALYSLAAHSALRPALLGLAATFCPGWLSVLQDVSRQEPSNRINVLVITGVAMTVFHVTVFGVGRWARWSVQQRRLVARRSAAEAVTRERRRIARDMHDVVAHAVTLMLLQAGGAAKLLRTEPERAEAALEQVDVLGQQAIVELRRLLNMLQLPVGPDARTSPPAGLHDLDRLIERAGTTGPGVELSVRGNPQSLDRGADVSAYRIVQEALTNATRYAAPETPIRVYLAWSPRELEIRVSNRIGGGAAGKHLSAGRGLITMNERARACGGTIEAGPQSDGNFLVHARLPVKPETGSETIFGSEGGGE